MRRAHRLAVHVLALVAAAPAACGDGNVPDPVGPPGANPGRDITETRLALDATARTGIATITFAGSDEPATLEVGDLEIERVQQDGADLAHTLANGRLELALPRGSEPATVEIAYRWKHHELEGASPRGYTFVWPYYCGNLFPCHSAPADGTRFALELTGVPAGKTAVFPAAIDAEAPSYQIAWAIGDYVELALGTTTAGTQLSVWYPPADAVKAQQSTAQLVAAFDWLEQHIGPYRFGPRAGSVVVDWGPSAPGAMEHHPFWHVSTQGLEGAENQVHEAAHGWFGDAVRLKCWEDLVLSEGTATYLAGRTLDAVAPTMGASLWSSYEQQLGLFSSSPGVWPQGCGTVDIIKDNLTSRALYLRGAFFYRGVALVVGADALDAALRAFYAAHAGGAATMADMLATIRDVTGYDPAVCADRWLRSATPPAIGPCP